MNPIQQKIKESLEEFDKQFAHAHAKTFSFGMYNDDRNITANEVKNFLKQSQLELLEVLKGEIEKNLDLPPPFSAIEEMPIKHVFQNEGYNKGLQDVLDLLKTNQE